MTMERTQIAEDLLVAALEGGSDYWIEKFKFVTVDDDPGYARALPYPDGLGAWKNGSAILIVTEMDSGEQFSVQPYDVLLSAEKFAKQKTISLEQLHDYHDAGDADEVLQLACFSEIIYG